MVNNIQEATSEPILGERVLEARCPFKLFEVADSHAGHRGSVGDVSDSFTPHKGSQKTEQFRMDTRIARAWDPKSIDTAHLPESAVTGEQVNMNPVLYCTDSDLKLGQFHKPGKRWGGWGFGRGSRNKGRELRIIRAEVTDCGGCYRESSYYSNLPQDLRPRASFQLGSHAEPQLQARLVPRLMLPTFTHHAASNESAPRTPVPNSLTCRQASETCSPTCLQYHTMKMTCLNWQNLHPLVVATEGRIEPLLMILS